MANLWTYEQKFDGLNDGDLNGQDSWSGATEFDVTTDAAALYEGTKGLKIYQPAGLKTIKRTLPASIESGEFWISVKATETTQLYPRININNDGDVIDLEIFFWSDGTIKYYSRDATDYVQIDSLTYSADTWIRLGVRFRCTGAAAFEGLNERTAKVSIDGGDNWSSELEFEAASGTDINYLELVGFADTGNYNYFDYISPNYVAPVVTDIKSVNGLAYASVKSKNGLAIGSIKSINNLE